MEKARKHPAVTEPTDASKGYLRAIEVLIDDQKMLALLSSVPLISIVSQLSYLSSVGGNAARVLATIGALCFLLSGAISLTTLSYARSFLAKETLGPDADSNAHPYLGYLIEVWERAKMPLTEANLTIFSRRAQRVIVPALTVGWLSTIFLVLLAIWSTSAEV